MAPRKTFTRDVPRDEYAGRWTKAKGRRAAMDRELDAGLYDPAVVLAVQAAKGARGILFQNRGELQFRINHNPSGRAPAGSIKVLVIKKVA